jgi:RNA polymerase sigma-70 factor, ECF subfamily
MTTMAADLLDPPWARPDAPLATAPDEAGIPDDCFAEHRSELLGYAQRSLRDREMAEDSVQETFLRAWRARARYDPSIASVRTWLFAIERRVIIDMAWARTRRAARSRESTIADASGSDDRMEQSMVSWQVQAAIRRLQPAHRQVLVEVYYRQRSGVEVADELGIPEGTVRSRLFYALRQLRLLLEELGWDGPDALS